MQYKKPTLKQWLKYKIDKMFDSQYDIIYLPEYHDKPYVVFRGMISIGNARTLNEAKQIMQDNIEEHKNHCAFCYDSNGNFVMKKDGF